MKSIFSKILYVLVLLAVSLPAMAQRNVITGVVYDESGLPLTGASVIVEGTNRGVTTDSYGKYRIEAAPEEALSLISWAIGARNSRWGPPPS